MIARIHGELIDVTNESALVQVEALTYEVLIPAADQPALLGRVGQPIEFHTFQYLEAQGQGSAFLPRLIGFASARDRAFFTLFTKVKGIGYRKALRAMAAPVSTIASAIASRDTRFLITLPEVGKRTAETIVAELHGKVETFAEPSTEAGASGGTNGAGTSRHAAAHDALSVLLQLGEPRVHAVRWIDRALADDPELISVDDLVTAAYRHREG